jgi:hypothetical protein
MDFFVWGYMKEHVYAVLHRSIEGLAARFEAAVTTVDVNMFRRVRVNAVWRTAVCLEMDVDRFEHLL